MIGKLNLKNESCSLKTLLSIITLGYLVFTVMLLMFYNSAGNLSKIFLNTDSDSHIVSDSKQLYSDTRRNDYYYYNDTYDNSKQGKLSNGSIQKVTYPVDVKKMEGKKPVDMQANISADPGMNATHIKGILMESVHVNYTRNIYFSVKTTHNNFDRRLFPLMLTWLQLVDKNKVRQY